MKKSTVSIVLAAVLVVGVVAVILANGGKKDDTSSATTKSSTSQSAATAAPSDAVEANAVTIQNYAFDAKDIKVKVGTTVTWTNQDSVKHSVTADTASADAPKSDLFGKGEAYSFTFKKAGTYSYHCEPHPYMKGTVTVTE